MPVLYRRRYLRMNSRAIDAEMRRAGHAEVGATRRWMMRWLCAPLISGEGIYAITRAASFTTREFPMNFS